MFIHDLIKIEYINSGYLPNYPYHMVTDNEMFHAFLDEDGYFDAMYPCVNEELRDVYDDLVIYIKDCIHSHINEGTDIPSWVYGYMLGTVTGPSSGSSKIADIYTLLGEADEMTTYTFTPELSMECYEISDAWVKKSVNNQRPPTIFGEPHVYKSLRLEDVNVLK